MPKRTIRPFPRGTKRPQDNCWRGYSFLESRTCLSRVGGGPRQPMWLSDPHCGTSFRPRPSAGSSIPRNVYVLDGTARLPGRIPVTDVNDGTNGTNAVNIVIDIFINLQNSNKMKYILISYIILFTMIYSVGKVQILTEGSQLTL